MIWYLSEDRKTLTLDYEGVTHTIGCSSRVHTLDSDEYRRTHPLKSIPSGEWYDPAPFPAGGWKVTGRPSIRNREHSPYIWPFFIPTDAGRYVDVWTVEDGTYARKTSVRVWDSGYGFHCSDIAYTDGCVRISCEDDLLLLVQIANVCLDRGEEIKVVAA